ncbi:MAG: HAD-IIIC family phosphatase [Salinivirgaceae bacterium]
MKIAVLSNVNLMPIKSFLNKKGFTDVNFSEYGQYHLDLISHDSEIHKFPPKYLWLHIDADILLNSELNQLPSVNMINDVDDICIALENYSKLHTLTQIIVSSFELSNANFINYLEFNSEYSFRKIEEGINARLLELAKINSNIFIMNFGKIVRQFGFNNLTNSKFWYLGRIKYTNQCFEEFSKEINYIIRAIEGKTKKVLILDLDNTLWGGIIGEDGMNGIMLSEDGEGKIYRDFQQKIKSLKQLGVILAICSKNNIEDSNVAFSHPMMVLKKNDFSSAKINWESKAKNISEIAEELSLGLDSFVFIDDNPRERAIIKQSYPEVEVPDFPVDITDLNSWFTEIIYEYFGKVTLSDEDRTKSEQYERLAARSIEKSSLNLDEFVASLQIRLNVDNHPVNHSKRLSQLSQKTNQFNLTTRRYSETEILDFLKSEKHIVFALEYEDKFGKEGIVGEAIVEVSNNIAIIDTYLLSCRVIGKNVEYNFLREIGIFISEKFPEIETIRGCFIPTSKNILTKDFYLNAGFIEGEIENEFYIKIKDLIK